MDSEILLDRFIIQDTLGGGGGGIVNLAWDTKMLRNVAIKRIRLPRNVIGAAIPGLEEARTSAHLNDSRIVNVYDFEIDRGEGLVIMEFVDGMSLGDLMDHIPRMLSTDEIASIVQNVGKGLQHAHKHGVLHLDVKPDNILIDSSGLSKVTDFGIARLAKGSGFGMATAGTIGYMSPEQLRGGLVDERSDQWAFAVMVYELLVGDNPFVTETFAKSLDLIESSEIYLPSSIVEDLNPEIDDVLFRALDPDPDTRYPSVSKFASELLECLGVPKTGRTSLAGLVRKMAKHVVLGSPEDRLATILEMQNSHVDEDDDYLGETVHFDNYDNGNEDEDEAYGSSRRRQSRSRRNGTLGQTAIREDYDERPVVHRQAFRDIVGERIAAIASRVVGAAACAGTAWIAVSSLSLNGWWWVLIAVVAALGAVAPKIGSLAAMVVLAVGAITSGWLPQGIIMVVLTAIWWLTTGIRGSTETNCAMLAPSTSLAGMGLISPISCGLFLSPVNALACSLYSAAIMLVLVPITGGSELYFTHNAILVSAAADYDNLILFYFSANPWLTAAGWVFGSLVLSLLANRRSKILSMLGLALCIAIIGASRTLGLIIDGTESILYLEMVIALALPLIVGIVLVWVVDSAVREKT